MPNIKLVVEYNGAGFHGFQFQPGLRTVQGELERILPILLREKPTHFVAAGRTDAGRVPGYSACQRCGGNRDCGGRSLYGPEDDG